MINKENAFGITNLEKVFPQNQFISSKFLEGYNKLYNGKMYKSIVPTIKETSMPALSSLTMKPLGKTGKEDYTILIIGNGFDLHHGLRTKYIDFMEFVNNGMKFNQEDSITEYNQERMNIFKELSSKNNLIQYFNDEEFEKEGWIDFEEEIEILLKKIEEYYNDLKDSTIEVILKKKRYYESLIKLFDNINIIFGVEKITRVKDYWFKHELNEEYINRYREKYNGKIFYKRNLKNKKEEVIEILYEELKDLITCFNIYLSEVIASKEVEIYKQILDINPDKIISFNYTDTYSKYYNSYTDKYVEVDFIHGKINYFDQYEDNNIILGIRENAFDNGENEDDKLEYIEFQKYFQKIRKGIVNKYKNWNGLKDIINKDNTEHEIHIIGHSLDTTDKNIFKDLFIKYSKIINIYYHNENSKISLMKNMIKIMGRENFIKYYESGKIRFIELEKNII